MMKKLQQEAKKDQENSERKSENKSEILFFSTSSFAAINHPIIIITSTSLSPSSDGNAIDRSTDIFHPPKA